MVFGVLDQILGESHAQVERVGSTHGGNVCFIQAKMPDSIEVLKGDGMNCYLNAITSHDGSQLARVFFSSIRIACTNQIRASIRHRSERAISIRHTKNAEIKLSVAGNLLMEGAQEWQIIKENAAIMAAKSVNRLQTKAFVEALFPAPTKEDGRDVNKAKREGVYELIENGLGTDIAGVKGSAWGLFSAATEYFDHHSSTKGETSHFARSLLSGDKFRDQVLELAMAV
jgi:phage/plasmid-like protein (TIGR03299 family)